MKVASQKAADDRLLKLAAIVEKSSRYNQEKWGHRCGTPACLAGHAEAAGFGRDFHAAFALPMDGHSGITGVSYWTLLFGQHGCGDAGRSGKKAAAFVRAFVAMRKAGMIPYHPGAK